MVSPTTGTTGYVAADTFVVGYINSWSTSRITFTVSVFDASYDDYCREDFAFVVLGI